MILYSIKDQFLLNPIIFDTNPRKTILIIMVLNYSVAIENIIYNLYIYHIWDISLYIMTIISIGSVKIIKEYIIQLNIRVFSHIL